MMNPYKHLLTKMKYLVNEDKRLDDEEKSDYQWSMIFTKGPVKFIIGKGGVNTIFYMLGDKREVCFPDDALKLLEKKALDKYIAYSIYSKDKKLVSGPFLFHDDVRAIKALKGQFLVGIKPSGKIVPLFSAKAGLFDKFAWSPIAEKK